MPHITPAHLHILVNHIPVIGFPFILFLLGWGLIRRQEDVIRAALIGTVLIAIGTWVTDLTGDGAKDDIRHTAWYSRDAVRAHADAADWANIVGIASGVLALGLLVMARGGNSVNRRGAYAVLGVIVIASAASAKAGYEGGKIRHDEFGNRPITDSLAPRQQ